MREEKRGKIIMVKTGNDVNSGAMNEFLNDKPEDFTLFNLCKGFFKVL